MPTKSSPGSSANEDMLVSYCTIRKAIGYIAILYAPVLVLGTWFIGGCPSLRDSVSAYYYSCTYPWFIGALCAVSLFLFTYKGYTGADQLVTNAASLFVLGVVFFPTNETNKYGICNVVNKPPNGFFDTAHYLSAGVFFLLMAYMSLFLFTKTDPQQEPTKEKLKRNRVYKICGIIMLVAMALIPCLMIPGVPQSFLNLRPEFWFECLVLIPFGISWLTKGEGLLKDK